MSGFEPFLLEAGAAEAGTAALASEVMAPELLGSLGAEFGTAAEFAGAGSGIAGLEGLTGLSGMAGEGLGALAGSAQSAIPTLAENVAAANPEVLGQMQNPILNTQVGANQLAFNPMSQSQIAELTNGIPTAGPGVDVATSAPGMGGAEEVLNGPASVVEPGGYTGLSSADKAALYGNEGYAGTTGDMTKQALYGNAGYGDTAGMVQPAGGNGIMDALKNMGSKMGKWWDKQSDEKKLLYGSAAGLGAMSLLGKKQGMPENKPYDGPLSKFSYNPSVYKPYTAQPPANPYQAQYKDYRAYAGGGPIEAMSNANAIGANTGYPMADIQKGAYATPWQTPISRNVVSDASDTGVNPITGEMAFARGGIADLGGYSDGGRMLKGPGDGMSDNIPATIAGKQPARLANEEFVVPADVVSHLGNGSSDAGAKQLYQMMDRVRQARTGQKKQGKQIKADKYLPA